MPSHGWLQRGLNRVKASLQKTEVKVEWAITRNSPSISLCTVLLPDIDPYGEPIPLPLESCHVMHEC